MFQNQSDPHGQRSGEATATRAVNRTGSLAQQGDSSGRPAAKLSQSHFTKSLAEELDIIPAMAVSMPLSAVLQDVRPAENAILGEGVDEDRAPTIETLGHQGIVYTPDEPVAIRANLAVEVPAPLLVQDTVHDRPRLANRRPRASKPGTNLWTPLKVEILNGPLDTSNLKF